MRNATTDLAFIRAWVREMKSGGAVAAVDRAPPPALAPIAITGVAACLPGCADVGAFWDRLDRDERLLSPIPADRFGPAAYPQSQDAVPPAGWGGFLSDIAAFDPAAFGILPLEAEEMDPRQRLLLMSAWRTLEDAGLDPRSLTRSNTGVFIACEGNEYAVLMSRAGCAPKMGFGQANSMVANGISYAFDFAGPSEMVDATCAGFAVALHRAVVALRAGLIDRAIVGAANLILLADPYRFLTDAGQLTTRDTVKSFGRDGDGFLRAEGVGTILVERQQDAEAAGRPVYAEIKHTAVNFNGRGGVSMASPNTEAHAALIKACYREAGIDPRHLSYIEAQGMGSPVADIAEWTAFNRALSELAAEKGITLEPGFCRVSTLKPMLGHMHSASSLGALLKVVRSFQTGRIHRVLNFTEPNEYCAMGGVPCRIATETEPWPQAGRRRLAALHAYGSGGNNAHVLLEEPRAAQRRSGPAAGPRYEFQTRPYWFDSRTARADAPAPGAPDVLRFIRGVLAADAGRFDADASFTDLGLDSMAVAPFVGRLEAEFGVALRRSDVFSHATPARLAGHIEALRHAAPAAGGTLRRRQRRAAAEDDIAIVGLSLQTAGAANVSEFWRLLREGRSAVGAIPPERWRGGAVPPGARGGFLADVDTFDPLFFRISPKESATIDPRHRQLLQAAWAAIEDSGHSPDEWRGAPHGVFLGIEESDYPYNAQSAITAVHGGTAPARIGYFLDLKGPVLAISTACSSSLVAVHYACRSLLDGESECALAGGCNIISQPALSFGALARMGGMLSPEGTCYAFDRRANGMVLGEAVGMVVLKRLADAVRDRDPIYAVIKASGINYDGRTNGITAPSGERQRELYERLQHESGIEPARIGYVVAHGTGTALGDPVEANALIDAFGGRPGRPAWCALTSPKTNVGHTQAASGIVNLITAALALRHGEIPPSLNFQEANPDIRFADSPFYVNTALKPWRDVERFAAVSSFGHTGTNAHALLGLAPVSPTAASHVRAAAVEARGYSNAGAGAEPAAGIVLSARTEEQLIDAARALGECPIADLADAAYTLQVGRAAMDERLGILATTVDELKEKLGAFLDGRDLPAGVHRGRAKRGDGTDAPVATDGARQRIDAGRDLLTPPPGVVDETRRIDELLKAWVNGVDVDWRKFHRSANRRRVHLPTYPFAREHYWLEPANPAEPAKPQPAKHPAAAGVVSAPAAGAAMEVMTFVDEWVESPIPAGALATIRTAVGVLGDGPGGEAWRDAMRRAAPQVEWRFVSLPANADAATVRAALSRSADAVVWLGACETPGLVNDPSSGLPLIQGIAAAAPARLVFVLPFARGLERCHADAWVAYERSLKPVLAGTRVAVVAIGRGANDTIVPDDIARRVWTELTTAELQSVIYERDRRHVRRIGPATPAPTRSGLVRGGTYLITGGGGSLGFACAEYLATTYAAKLLLVGRSALDAAQRARLDALNRGPGEAVYQQVDVCEPRVLQAAVDAARRQWGPITGVIHAAGVGGTRSILEKDAAEFRRVLDPKVNGTLALDAALRDEPLQFVVYFSSIAAALGDFGSCDYAIGSRFLAAYASHRNDLRERGERRGRAVVIEWPVWSTGRMGQAESEATRFYLSTSGQRALDPAEGLALLDRLLGDTAAQHLVLVGQRDRVRRFLGLDASAETLAVPAQLDPWRRPELAGLALDACVRSDLQRLIGTQLNIESRKVGPDTNLADFGYDSISLAEFAERLGAHYGLKVTPALFFGHSTVQRLARHFLDEHRAVIERFYAEHAEPAAAATPAAVPTVAASVAAAPVRIAAPAARRDEPVAIIGMSGRFPGARSIAEMWRILAEGRDAVGEVPADRFDAGTAAGKWMGCLPGVAEFDPLFFEISPSEAEAMDPRQRHLLQEAWNALEDAGVGPRQLAGQRVGVFAGVEEGDYAFVAPEGELTSNHNAILASRLAYLLDFRGPVMAINTACSSGLVALHQACASLRNGECDLALVASASLQLTPAGHLAMGRSGMLSADGKCHVFDRAANGLVPGEAAVVVVLKRRADAEADGDAIRAVIRASGVNYDGRTNGITAPSGVAQVELLESVYAGAGIDPGTIEYVVAHGTGTRLGDPVEVNALQTVFKRASSRRGHCALTSTKSNFGHTFAASGLVSLACLVEALRHEEIPASLHCAEENDYIAWDDSPLYVNKRAKRWPARAAERRRGAVSAFGMSGTNAHVVVEDHAATGAPEPSAAPAHLLALSAKTEAALQEKIAALVAALRTDELRAAGLARISATLLDGRHHFAHRVAVVAGNTDDAIGALVKAQAGELALNVCRGRVAPDFTAQPALRRQAEALLAHAPAQLQDRVAYRETLAALAELYCQGYELPWPVLFGERMPRRIALPTYPFARETYWPKKPTTAPTSTATERLHPLVHANTSTLHEQRFSSVFTGAEPVLADHRVYGQRVFPAAGYLEVARAAAELSVPAGERTATVVLSQVVWPTALVVAESGRPVDVVLAGDGGRIEFEVRSAAAEAAAVVHARGHIAYVPEPEPVRLDLAALRQRTTVAGFDAAAVYAGFRAAGVDYGPSYRALGDVRIGEGEVLARIALPADCRRAAEPYRLNPMLIDAAFQATIGLELAATAPTPARIPFALERLTQSAAMAAEAWVWARRAGEPNAGMTTYDLDIADDNGRVVVAIRGFATRTAAMPETGTKVGGPFARVLTGTEFYVADHGGVLPGVVSLEWARAAGRLTLGRAVTGLKNVVWNAPVACAGGSREVQTELTRAGSGCAYRVVAGDTVHAQGVVTTDEHAAASAPVLALDAIRTRCGSSLTADECDRLVNAALGPRMRSLTRLTHNRTEALAELALPAGMAGTAEEFILHPAVLNGAIQACTVLARLTEPEETAPTPFSIDDLRIHGPIPAEAYAHVTRASDTGPAPAGSRLHVFDLVITDRGGNVAVSIRRYAAVAPRAAVTLFAVPCWREAGGSAGAPRAFAIPVFLLTPGTLRLRPQLEAAWPQARIEYLGEAGCGNGVEADFCRVFALVQHRLRDLPSLGVPIALLADDVADAALCAASAALFRTARMEQPRLHVKVVRLGGAVEADAFPARLTAELGLHADDVDVRFARNREVRALRELELPAAAAETRTGEVIWITGGLGGVGRAFARHFAVERKAVVFLSGRSPLDDGKRRFLQEFEAAGGRVEYLSGDVADPADVERMVASILSAAGRLNGIIHAAGVIEDGLLPDKSVEAIARVWRPKVAGALALDAATRHLKLEFFAMCSSLTGSFGNAGQADYAGANAVLDAFAAERNRRVAAGERHGRTFSVAWPLWRDGGMRMDPATEQLLEQRSGMTPMPSAPAMIAFELARRSEHAHVLVLHGHGERMRSRLLAMPTAAPKAVSVRPTADVGEERIHATLRAIVVEQQKIPADRVELDVELPRYGFDSIRLTELATRLNREFGLELMPTLFFEHTTLRAVAKHLVEKHAAALAARLAPAAPVAFTSEAKPSRFAGARLDVGGVPSPREAPRPLQSAGWGHPSHMKLGPSAEPAAPPVAHPVPIAIVGMSGRFPGSADVEEFWRHLEANEDLVTEVPADRWDWRELYGDPVEEPGRTNVTSAGFMAGIDQFDPAFFGISPREAIALDPQFRLLLQTVWSAIEDAGYRASDLAGTRTGVFTGISTSDYKDAWLRRAAGPGQDGPALVSHFVVANRISYLLDLHGPSEPVDTACSSALVAIHRAIEAIRQGNCDQAIVGGVNVIAAPDITIAASRAGMLSPDGRCKTFDRAADGYGRGEGVAALLLKPLDAARRDGDQVYAVIRGSAENHGGRAQSPTAPNPAAQRDLLIAAYTRAGIDPRTVGYLEAHGTGTALGDPIEVDGLCGAFEALYRQAGAEVGPRHCGLGSVKANIGHLEAAAGMAGIVKVVMMLRHRRMPGNVHLREPNPYLRLDRSPFYLVRETQDWAAALDPRGQPLPRRAGVSSFGIGGSNAHVILEEFPGDTASAPATAADQATAPQAIVLSARTPDRLDEAVRRLSDFLQVRPGAATPTLRELACTLQLGREPLEERLGFAAASLDEAVATLSAVAATGAAPGVYRGRIAGERSFGAVVAPDVAAEPGGDVNRLLAAWARGGDVDWRPWWRDARPRRVSLPTYPFARNRYWFGAAGEGGRNGGAPAMVAPAKPVPPVEPAPATAPAREAIEAYLAATLAKILYVPEGTLDRTRSFIDLGLDSVLAVEWIQAIKQQYGIKIPATKVYDHPTVSALTGFVAAALGARGAVSAGEPPAAGHALEDILEQVRANRLSVAEADRLIEQLGLDRPADQGATP